VYIYAAILIFGLLSGFASGWKVQAWRHDSADLAAQEQARETEKMRRQAAGFAATSHETAKERIRTEFVTITERVTNVVKADPVAAAAVCLNPDGLRILAEAARATGYAGKPSGAVSAPVATD
jgi:hypothetical protein